MATSPPWSNAPLLVWMSTMPAVRKPYCAGSEPVMSCMLLHEARIELQAEPGDAFGQQHVVDAVLQVRVLAADVQVAVRRRILGHARRAQEHLVEGRVGPLGQVEDLLLVHDERGRAQAGLDRFRGSRRARR